MLGRIPPQTLREPVEELASLEGSTRVALIKAMADRPTVTRIHQLFFMLLEDERGTVNLIAPPPVYERRRALVRAAPLLRARGRLERRDGAINVVVAEIEALEWGGSPNPSERRRARRLAVAELRAVAPAGHSFGRRGR